MAKGYTRYSSDLLGFYRNQGSDEEVSFTVVMNGEEIQAWFGAREGAAHECSLVIVHETSLNERREVALADILNQRLPAGSTYYENEDIARRWPDHNYFFQQGIPLPIATLPPTLQDFFSAEYDLLTSAIRRVIWALRWRFGVEGPLNWGTGSKFEFSLDGESFFPAPIRLSMYSSTSRAGTLLNEDTAREIGRIASGDPDWLPHELLRESREDSSGKTRSALLLSIAAVEIGVKRLIAKLAPTAAWLVIEAPSPPIVKIVKDYLPTLHTELGTAFTIKGDVLKDLEKAVTLRNNLAHRGEANINFEWLHSWLRRCYDLLYFFDYLGGNRWAARCAELHLVVEPIGAQTLPFDHFDEKTRRWVAMDFS